MNTLNFIKKARLIHKNLYDYSVTHYIASNLKLSIKCKVHGVFEQLPSVHLNGSGCKICGKLKTINSHRLTTKSFIEKAKSIHNNKYNYSLVEYPKNNSELIKIICPIHGQFDQTPRNHLRSHGCPKCGKLKNFASNTYTQAEIIGKFKKLHKNKYDYSLTIYKGIKTKVKIICPIHGLFEQTPDSHLNNGGCDKCGKISKGLKKRLTQNEFLSKAKEIHGNKYNYHISKYKTANEKIEIKCKKHGIFLQKAIVHLQGYGCPACSGNKPLDKNEFIKRAQNIHGHRYNYTESVYNGIHEKLKIECFIHGIYMQTANSHLQGNGCPFCNESKGEKIISMYLENKNINFIRQKRFTDCRDKLPLPFDFYLPELNLLIEYDGEQHFTEKSNFGKFRNKSTLEERQIKDKIKTDYAKLKGYILLRIHYNKIHSIEKIISNKIKTLTS